MIGCRTALVIFAAVTFYAACQEEAGVYHGPSLTPQQLRGIHGHIDKDKDGKASMMEALDYATKVEKIEASKAVVHHLEAIDGNRDGKLSLDEILSDTKMRHRDDKKEDIKKAIKLEKTKFKVADANQDGFLSAEEFLSFLWPGTHDGVLEVAVKHSLVSKDQDGDNQLSQAEWFAKPDPESRFAKPDPESSLDDEKESFKKMDKDGNGFLNFEELKVVESGLLDRKQWLQNVFDIADTDKDMHLSANEMEEAAEMVEHDKHRDFLEWAARYEL